MYPIGSNGASQALLDAKALASVMSTATDAKEALRAYERQRLEATSRIVLLNRENGPDKIMEMMEDRAPWMGLKISTTLYRTKNWKRSPITTKGGGFDKASLTDSQ